MTTPATFKDLLRRLLPDEHRKRRAPFRSQRELASALQVEPNTVSRILRSDDVLDAAGCLRLAMIGHYPLSLVFTLARKPEIAQLIEEATGPSTLTPEQRDVLAVWPQLPAEIRATLLRAIKDYLSRTPSPRKPSSLP